MRACVEGLCVKARGGGYSEGLPLHILDVSCLVSSGLDLRARHLLILRDNCSWESVRVQVSFTSRVHVYPPREAPRSAPESSPMHCEGRKDPKSFPRAIAIYMCVYWGETHKLSKASSQAHDLSGIFLYMSPFK